MLRVLWREVALVLSIVAGFVALVHSMLGETAVGWILACLCFLCLHCIVRWTGGAPLVGPLGPRPARKPSSDRASTRVANGEPPTAATSAPRAKPPQRRPIAPPFPQPPMPPGFLAPLPGGPVKDASTRPADALRRLDAPMAQVEALSDPDDDARWVPEPIVERAKHDKRRPPKQTWTGL